MTRSVTERGPAGPVYVNVAVSPVPICSVPVPVEPPDVHGVATHSPVERKVVTCIRTAGFGVIEKSAVGGSGVGVGGGRVIGQPLASTGVPAGVPGHQSEVFGTPSPSPSAGGLPAWSA